MADIEMPQTATVQYQGVVLPLPAELDVATAADLRTIGLIALESFDVGPLFLDMADVEFIDAAGIAALIDLDAAAHECGRDVVLVHVGPKIHRVLGMCDGTDRLHFGPGDGVGTARAAIPVRWPGT